MKRPTALNYFMLLMCLCAFDSFDAQVINSTNVLPPVIVEHPNQVTSRFYTHKKSTLVLPCTVSGPPGLKFRWLRNGITVPPKPTPKKTPLANYAFYNTDPTSVDGIFNGTMVIVGTSKSLTGAYQCFASLSNAPHIKVMSDFAYVQEQYLTPFPAANLQLTTKSVAPGEYVQLACAVLVMVPTPTVYWELKDQPQAPLIDNERIVLDDKGTLHILSATPQGFEFAGQLQCVQNNSKEDYTRGKPTDLTLDTGVSVGYRAPKAVYVSDSPKYVLAGEWDGTEERRTAQTAYCIFTANPAPTVQWYRADGAPIGMGVVANGPLLWFRNAVAADSGIYNCTAVNMDGDVTSLPVTQQVRVDVQSKPRLIRDVYPIANSTVGDNVTVDCTANGSPAPSYNWYINSVPEDYTVNRKSRLVDGSKLTIYRVGKSEDLLVITCNASNTLGSFIRTVGIKVYNKTRILGYTPFLYANLANPVVLTCTAETDASLPIDVYWTRKGSSTRIVNAPERHVLVSMGDRGKTARLSLDLGRMNKSEVHHWAYGPDYECVASTTIANSVRVTSKIQMPKTAASQVTTKSQAPKTTTLVTAKLPLPETETTQATTQSQLAETSTTAQTTTKVQQPATTATTTRPTQPETTSTQATTKLKQPETTSTLPTTTETTSTEATTTETTSTQATTKLQQPETTSTQATTTETTSTFPTTMETTSTLHTTTETTSTQSTTKLQEPETTSTQATTKLQQLETTTTLKQVETTSTQATTTLKQVETTSTQATTTLKQVETTSAQAKAKVHQHLETATMKVTTNGGLQPPESAALLSVCNKTETVLSVMADVQMVCLEVWKIGIFFGVVLLTAVVVGIVYAARRQRGNIYKEDTKEFGQGNGSMKEQRRSYPKRGRPSISYRLLKMIRNSC